MFSHIMVGTSDVERAKTFYDATFAVVGVKPGMNAGHRVFYRSPTGTFAATLPINGQPVSAANGGTIGFACSSPEQVDAWHAAGLAAGGTTCEDPPGERPGSNLYLAYLRDPDGNKLCGLYRMT
jgi:catechol 2,3-dioxygenase-like lactoylglutathione lyase family enzyme